MIKSKLIRIARNIIDETGTAVLATVAKDAEPRMRWMSPVFLRGYEDYIYAVTSARFNKTVDLQKHSDVQWMIQTASLSRIITLNGKMHVVENMSLKNEILEELGVRLRTFWTVNGDPSSLVVLETEILSGLLFSPVEGTKELVSFKKEA